MTRPQLSQSKRKDVVGIGVLALVSAAALVGVEATPLDTDRDASRDKWNVERVLLVLGELVPVKNGTAAYGAVNLRSLREGFRGQEYGKLVEHFVRRFDVAHLLNAGLGTVELLGPDAGELVEEFLDRWNPHGYDAAFWRRDCAEVFDEIVRDARQILKASRLPTDNETAFNLFQAVTINFAYSAADQPQMRKVMGIRKGWFRR